MFYAEKDHVAVHELPSVSAPAYIGAILFITHLARKPISAPLAYLSVNLVAFKEREYVQYTSNVHSCAGFTIRVRRRCNNDHVCLIEATFRFTVVLHIQSYTGVTS